MRAPRPSGRTLRRVLTLATVLVLGLLLGRVSAPSPTTSPTGRAPASGRSEARPESGVRVDFPQTAAGAAEAIAAYQEAFAEPSVLGRGVLRARVRAVATPDYAARMLAVNGPGEERLAAGPVGVGLGEGVRTIYKEVPIGYRILGYGDGRARVETWGMTLLGNSGSVEPSAWFGTSRTDLVWEGGRWRIADTRSGFGPTPRFGTKPGALGGYEVLELAKELHDYAPGD